MNKLINKVMTDLKDVLPYKENIKWDTFKSIRTLGRYKIRENKILINEYLKDEKEILDVMAHELIHACGVHGHRYEFQRYMRIINSLGLGYNVTTRYKGNDSNFRKVQEEIRNNRKTSNKQYLVYCTCCGWSRAYSRKHHKLSNYVCPKCRGKLGQNKI